MDLDDFYDIFMAPARYEGLTVSQLRYIAELVKGGPIMPAQTSMIHVRIDDHVKTQAAETLAGFGLTVSDAVRILLTRVAREGGLPAGLTANPQAHDEWFRAKVNEAIADARSISTHQQVIDEAQEPIDSKRRARRSV